MAESLDPLSDRACRMTDAYNTGIEITEQLREGDSLLLSGVSGCSAVVGFTPVVKGGTLSSIQVVSRIQLRPL